MSDVKRYDPDTDVHNNVVMEECPIGDYVKHCDYEALTAERDALREQVTWQHIETLEKDSNYVLFLFKNGRIREGSFESIRQTTERFIASTFTSYERGSFYLDEDGEVFEEKPTHWTHLPTLPNQQGDC